MKKRVLLSGILVLGLVSVWASRLEAERPKLKGSTPRILLASADLQAVKIEPLKTLDKTSVYQLTLSLREGQEFLRGAEVEYEIHALDGSALGGGMFTVDQQMLTSGGNTLTVLTGFSGLKLSPQQLMIFKLADPGFAQTRPQASGRSAEKQIITDTCTTFCDRCGDRAESLCTNGASTYSCECSETSRSCEFTCQSGSGTSKPPV